MKTTTQKEEAAVSMDSRNLDESNLEAWLEVQVGGRSRGTVLAPPPGIYRGGLLLDGVSIIRPENGGSVVIFAEGGCCLRTRGTVRLEGVTVLLSCPHGHSAASAVIVEEGVLQMKDCKVFSKAFCGMSVMSEQAAAEVEHSHFSGLEFGVLVRGGADCTLTDSHAVAGSGHGVAVRRGKLAAKRTTMNGGQTGLWLCEGEAVLEDCDLSGWSGENCRVDRHAKLTHR